MHKIICINVSIQSQRISKAPESKKQDHKVQTIKYHIPCSKVKDQNNHLIVNKFVICRGNYHCINTEPKT